MIVNGESSPFAQSGHIWASLSEKQGFGLLELLYSETFQSSLCC